MINPFIIIDYRRFRVFSLLCFMLTGCTPTQQSAPVSPPPDPTISTDIVNNYINKTFIALLGREPIGAETAEMTQILSQNHLSRADQVAFMKWVMAQPDYNEQIYLKGRSDYLNFIFHPSIIQETIDIWERLPKTAHNLAEIKRLYRLRSIPELLDSGKIDEKQLQRMLVHNSFYDFVNMGTENFVVSMFENFFHRFPTKHELDQGKKIVDGKGGYLFRRWGNSKEQFLDIFFSSDSYYEGQVVDNFRRLLYRDPNSAEMVKYTTQFKAHKDYKQLLLAITTLDEYVGIQREGETP